MKIGVVSDTHSKELPAQIIEDFKRVDLIIHAGDICDIETYELFNRIKETKAVCGNMDNRQIAAKFPQRQILEFGRFRIGVFHGEGPAKKVLERVQKEFAGEKLDAVVFGHSHQPFKERIKGVLYFNPGSLTDKVFAPYRSYGILDLKDDGLDAKIIRVKEK